MRIVLDFKDIKNKEELHKYLKEVLELPDYYGNNLDALYDCMAEKERKNLIIVYHYEELKKELGEYAEILIQVFVDIGAMIEMN